MTQKTYLSSIQVRQRYGGVSVMWIVRRLADDSGFPKPIYIGKRRYWPLEALEGWERTQLVKNTAA
jgi:predicted DNA-binding transcriptional regulator AlpA